MIEDFFDMRECEEQIRRKNERREEIIKALHAKNKIEEERICKIDLNKDKKTIDDYILANVKIKKLSFIPKKQPYFYNYFYNDGKYLRETPFNYNLIRKEKEKEKPIKNKKSEKRRKIKKDSKCAHCGSENTPLWRHLEDIIVCNACWLYYKSHKEKRPIKLNEKGIVRRQKRKKIIK